MYVFVALKYNIDEAITMESIINMNFNMNIRTLEHLPALRLYNEANNMKPNFARLARELDKGWRTIKRYYEEGAPSKKRNRKSPIDAYKELLDQLLLDENTMQ